MQTETFELIDKAVAGNKKALEGLILGVEDMIYNLSLRMLGSVYDAQDATQEIIIKIITQLSAFRKECAFSTWVYRVAANYLINYKKSMFAQRPLSFEFYGQDIDAGFLPNSDDLLQGVEEAVLADELKQSCTNVMLQCLDPESRCIYVLGLMFKVDSKVCADIYLALHRRPTAKDCPGSGKEWRSFWENTADCPKQENAAAKRGWVTQYRPIGWIPRIWNTVNLRPLRITPLNRLWKKWMSCPLSLRICPSTGRRRKRERFWISCFPRTA